MDVNLKQRRRHSAAFKAQVLAACAEPGASVAAVALSFGLNDNLVHQWRRGRGANPALYQVDITEGSGSGVKILNQPAPPPSRESVRCTEQNLTRAPENWSVTESHASTSSRSSFGRSPLWASACF